MIIPVPSLREFLRIYDLVIYDLLFIYDLAI